MTDIGKSGGEWKPAVEDLKNRLLSEAIGKKTYVSTLFLPQDRGFGWRESLIMEGKTPVYVE